MQKKTTHRIKQTGEVFTPTILVNEVLDKVSADIWEIPTKLLLDPACGDGEFLMVMKQRLMKFHDEAHILENMIFGVDLMQDNIERCIERLYGKGVIQPIPKKKLPLYGKRPGIKNMFTHNGIIIKHIIQADGVIYDYSFNDYSHEDSDINIIW